MFNIKEGNEYYVYMHIFPNNKVYIGITSQSPPEKRWLESGVGYKPQPRMWRAIQKYGWGNVDHVIIARQVNIITAKNMEIDLIALYDSTDKNHGYNASPGGCIMGEESRKKLSESCKGRKLSEEHKEKLRQAGKNRKPSDKSIERLREYNRTRDYSKMVQPNEMPILQYNVETGELVSEYKSINSASQKYKLDPRSIKQCIDEKVANYHGYLWVLKKNATDEYVSNRLYNAQNPPRFCPIKVIDNYFPDNIEYYRFINDMCREKGLNKSLAARCVQNGRMCYNRYKIIRISIPEYVNATGNHFFNY